jgi:serine/threonine-protein kinase
LDGSGTDQLDLALQPIGRVELEAKVAIDPQGYWLASLSQPSATHLQLSFMQLLGQHRFIPASALILHQPSMPDVSLNLLAVDSHHLALVTTPLSLIGQPDPELGQIPGSGVHAGSTIHLLTRRGDRIGSIQAGVRLQHLILTPTPYRLLAIEADQPGTVLLVDLKPYRIRRLWIEITPTFLAVTDWGYILAESRGRIVIVDLEGRQVGAFESPFPITAITPVQPYGLLVATWDKGQGYLYSLDLRTLGIDLVF